MSSVLATSEIDSQKYVLLNDLLSAIYLQAAKLTNIMRERRTVQAARGAPKDETLHSTGIEHPTLGETAKIVFIGDAKAAPSITTYEGEMFAVTIRRQRVKGNTHK